MFRTETFRSDINGDGLFDATKTIAKEIIDGRVVEQTTTEVNTLYAQNTTTKLSYAYDGLDLPATEVKQVDLNSDGVFEFIDTTERTFDGEGHLIQELVKSGDLDGDGVDGDYQNLTTFTENGSGSLVEKLTTYSAYGVTNPADYRLEKWTYLADGQTLLSHTIDDPAEYDNEIIRTNTYKNGNLINIKEQNEYRYGDSRPRIDESMTYNKDGTIKTHTDWADWTDSEGWFQRKDIAYTWGDHYDKQLITYDQTGDFDPELIKKVEHWYNSDGNLTHTLESIDRGGDGGPLVGGFDTRNLTVASWVDGVKVAEYTDIGIDGVPNETYACADSDFLLT